MHVSGTLLLTQEGEGGLTEGAPVGPRAPRKPDPRAVCVYVCRVCLRVCLRVCGYHSPSQLYWLAEEPD